jgi:hypothetical protein
MKENNSKKKLKEYHKFELEKESEKNKGNTKDNAFDKDYKDSENRLLHILCFILIFGLLLIGLNNCIRTCFSLMSNTSGQVCFGVIRQGKLYSNLWFGYWWLEYVIVTIVFVVAFVKLRGLWFSKVVFSWKKQYLNDYYSKIEDYNNEFNKSRGIATESVVEHIVSGPNGSMIGLLESLLYVGAVFMKSYPLLGLILAVRSYVAVSSHDNKEESEFYIMGLLGGLVYSIAFALMFAWISAYCFNIDWFKAVFIR